MRGRKQRKHTSTSELMGPLEDADDTLLGRRVGYRATQKGITVDKTVSSVDA